MATFCYGNFCYGNFLLWQLLLWQLFAMATFALATFAMATFAMATFAMATFAMATFAVATSAIAYLHDIFGRRPLWQRVARACFELSILNKTNLPQLMSCWCLTSTSMAYGGQNSTTPHAVQFV
jgi:hypothetical protein